MNAENYQNLIIGSGVAGKILAWTLASQDQKTVVVERAMVGGSCPNVACLPSKNVIYSAKAVSLVHPTRGLGMVTGSVRVDMAGVARRKWQRSSAVSGSHLDLPRAVRTIEQPLHFHPPPAHRACRNPFASRMLNIQVLIDDARCFQV